MGDSVVWPIDDIGHFWKKIKLQENFPKKQVICIFWAYLVANTPLSLVSCIRPKITNFFQKNIEKTGFLWKSDILQNSVKSTWGRLVKMEHCELIIEFFIVPIALKQPLEGFWIDLILLEALLFLENYFLNVGSRWPPLGQVGSENTPWPSEG